jgi:hypothetical protein
VDTRTRRPTLDLDRIPGRWVHAKPLLGNTLELLRPDFHRQLLRWADAHGGIYRCGAVLRFWGVLCCDAFEAVLCCAVLCCAVLCCAVLCCAVLRSAVLCAQCPPGKGIKEAGSRALEACAAIGAQRLVKTVVEQMSRWARDA